MGGCDVLAAYDQDGLHAVTPWLCACMEGPLASLSALSDCMHAPGACQLGSTACYSVISRGYNVTAGSASAQTLGLAWQTHTACSVVRALASTHSFRLTGAAAWTRFFGALQVNTSFPVFALLEALPACCCPCMCNAYTCIALGPGSAAFLLSPKYGSSHPYARSGAR